MSLSWILNCLGAGGKFCGGFDINVFTKVHQTGNGMPFTCTVVSSMLGFLLTGSCLPLPLLTCATLVACRGCITYAGRISRACIKHDGRYSFFSPHHLYVIIPFCICFRFFLPISQFLDPFICRGQKTFCCSHSRSCIGWWPRVDYGMAFLPDVARADC